MLSTVQLSMLKCDVPASNPGYKLPTPGTPTVQARPGLAREARRATGCWLADWLASLLADHAQSEDRATESGDT